MADPQVAPSTGASSFVPPPAGTDWSRIRLSVLLVLLVVAIVLVVHNFVAAGPAAERAYQDLEKFIASANASSVQDIQRLTPEAIQEHLGRQPTSERVDENGLWKEEYFRYGYVPGKQYVCVLYRRSGDDWLVIYHLLNNTPEPEDYPRAPEPQTPAEGDAAANAKSSDAQASEGKAGDKKPADAEPAEGDQPTNEASEDQPSSDKS